MDNNVIEIIKSFKETKKAIDEFVPLLTDYSEYSVEVKDAINLIKSAKIEDSNKELKTSVDKLEKAQKEIDKAITLLNSKNEQYSKQVDEFEKIINLKIENIEKNNKNLINDFEAKIENKYKTLESAVNSKSKSLDDKLDKIINLINSSNNNKTLENIEKSIRNIEDVFK